MVEKTKKKAAKKVPKLEITKENKEEILIRLAQQNLDFTKKNYNYLLKVLVKYDIKNVASSAIRAEEMFQEGLLKDLNYCIKNKKSYAGMLFGDGKKLSKVEGIKSIIKYYEELINLAENRISMLNQNTKMKIASDSIKFMNLYLKGMFKRAEKVNKELNKEDKK